MMVKNLDTTKTAGRRVCTNFKGMPVIILIYVLISVSIITDMRASTNTNTNTKKL